MHGQCSSKELKKRKRSPEGGDLLRVGFRRLEHNVEELGNERWWIEKGRKPNGGKAEPEPKQDVAHQRFLGQLVLRDILIHRRCSLLLRQVG